MWLYLKTETLEKLHKGLIHFSVIWHVPLEKQQIMTQSRQMNDRLKTWTGGNQIQVKEMPTETMTLYN